MQRFLFIAVICAIICPIAAIAQKQHTLYFTNGNKALEGKWSYASNGFFPARLTYQMADIEWTSMLAGNGGLAGSRRGVSSADYLLSIRPEGLLTAWNQSGAKMMEITFRDGIANGPFKRYRRDGGLREEGRFKNGMSDGPWKLYDDTGRLVLSGSYIPYTEEELAERWDRSYRFLFRDYGDNTAISREMQRTQEYMSQQSKDDSARAVRRFLEVFDLADRTAVSDAKRDGDFTVITSISPLTYHLRYSNDLRTGKWTYTDPDNKPIVALEYDAAGTLSAITDTNGKRLSPAEIAVAYRQYAENSRKERDAFWQGINSADRNTGERQSSAYNDSPLPDTTQIFSIVEQMPAFTGDLSLYLQRNLRYPDKAREKGVQGRAVVQFIVRRDGSISNATITRSSGNASLDAEAIRVVRGMPRWKPGRQQGQPVHTYFTVPLTFTLQ